MRAGLRDQSGQTFSRSDPLEHAELNRLRRVELDHAVRRVDVFGELDFANAVQSGVEKGRRQPVQNVAGNRQQLSRLPQLAQIVRPFAIEPDPLASNVKPRAHPVAVLR